MGLRQGFTLPGATCLCAGGHSSYPNISTQSRDLHYAPVTLLSPPQLLMILKGAQIPSTDQPQGQVAKIISDKSHAMSFFLPQAANCLNQSDLQKNALRLSGLLLCARQMPSLLTGRDCSNCVSDKVFYPCPCQATQGCYDGAWLWHVLGRVYLTF